MTLNIFGHDVDIITIGTSAVTVFTVSKGLLFQRYATRVRQLFPEPIGNTQPHWAAVCVMLDIEILLYLLQPGFKFDSEHKGTMYKLIKKSCRKHYPNSPLPSQVVFYMGFDYMLTLSSK
jgi:hypothetical protein